MFIQTLGGIEQAPHLTEHHGTEMGVGGGGGQEAASQGELRSCGKYQNSASGGDTRDIREMREGMESGQYLFDNL